MKTKVLFFSLLLLKLCHAQNEFIDMNFGANGGYTLYETTDESITLTSIVEINGDIYASMLGSSWSILKFNSNGIVDDSFGINGRLNLGNTGSGWTIDSAHGSLLTKTNDNKLLLINGASPNNHPENSRVLVTKINLDGTIDDSYGTNGQYISNLPLGIELIGIHKTNDDEIIAIGYNTFGNENDATQNIIIIKIDNQGHTDNTFGDNGVIQLPYDYLTYRPFQGVFKDNNVYILFNNVIGDSYIIKYNTSLLNYDNNFGTNGVLEINNYDQNEYLTAFTIDDSNNIYISGVGGVPGLYIYKYINNNLDSNFGNNGILNINLIPNAYTSEQPYTINIHNDKLILTGELFNFDAENYEKTFLIQSDLNGNLDEDFGVNGTIINNLFNFADYTYNYINFDDSIISCGSCPNSIGTDSQVPCIVKYLKSPNLSLNEVEKNKLTVFPNPTSEFLYFKTSDINEIKVFESSGRFVKSYRVIDNKVDLHELMPGMYFIIAKSKNEQFNFKVLIK